MALKLDRMTSDAMYMKCRTAEVIVAEKKSGAGKYGAISVHADNMMPMKVLLEAWPRRKRAPKEEVKGWITSKSVSEAQG